MEEEEVVQDVMECIQAMSNRKRSLTEVGGNESVEGGSCYEGNLAALHRKSVIR